VTCYPKEYFYHQTSQNQGQPDTAVAKKNYKMEMESEKRKKYSAANRAIQIVSCLQILHP
jgi:hypothetical protein